MIWGAIFRRQMKINSGGIVSHYQNTLSNRKIQTLTVGDRTFTLHSKRYWKEAITTMLWLYVLKSFVEQINDTKAHDGDFNPMENFDGITTDINIPSHMSMSSLHTLGKD